MRAKAQIAGLMDMASWHKVQRNLARIMDIRILDMDIGHQTLKLVYDSPRAFERAKQELQRIGCPIVHCTFETALQNNQKPKKKQHHHAIRNTRK